MERRQHILGGGSVERRQRDKDKDMAMEEAVEGQAKGGTKDRVSLHIEREDFQVTVTGTGSEAYRIARKILEGTEIEDQIKELGGYETPNRGEVP